MTEEMLKKIREKYNLAVAKKFSNLSQAKRMEESSSQIERYLTLRGISPIGQREFNLSNSAKRKMIVNIVDGIVYKARDIETNGIYCYSGVDVCVVDGILLPKAPKSQNNAREYVDIENPKEKKYVLYPECIEFERNNKVIYCDNYKTARSEFLSSMVYNGQEETVKVFIKRHKKKK